MKGLGVDGRDVRGVGPRFYVTPRRRVSLGVVLLALVLAPAVLFGVVRAMRVGQGVGGGAGDDADDPSQVDTIYLGSPREALVAKRPGAQGGGRPGAVHPFKVVRLPREGAEAGQIPDTAAGRRLYAWMAAFNGSDPAAFGRALPTVAPGVTEAAMVELRRETGGFRLVSAKEVAPGVMVFRLQDQTAAAKEALGTLQIEEGRVVSFSLGEVVVEGR